MTLRFCLFIVLMSLHGATLAQGALEPPAPPGPTMKTLDQVEPRIPFSEAVTINEAGSYYLTNDISGSFTIQADNVTLDLNGFTITPEFPVAIRVFGSDNLRIFNGAIAGGEAAGISGLGMGSVSISDLQFFDITGACIELSNPSGILMIERIRCHQATREGIMIRQGEDQPLHVVIRDNVISNVATTTAASTYGIGVFHNATGDLNVVVTGNKMMNNRVWGLGIRGGDNATVSGQVTDNLASGNGGPGIQVLADVVVAKNIAAGNGSNYNVNSQRAAPITALDQNPGPWDNISE
ncbi:MAG: right-handed parallel beta-helix repeat-containing protein [Wenzhouxiangella sp.]|jgi:hypothetical protein|nr:right-handed parallel beta-helix repeat-containing protein [Wenzhouxiangella sp.]